MPRGRPPKKSSEQDFPYGSIKKIVNHSLDPQTRLVTLTVSLAANKAAAAGRADDKQISEWDAQEFRPELLQAYWDSFAGKTRQDVLGIGELYHPFRILRHRRVRGQWQVLVQWLGYSTAGEDVSWEPASKLRHDAPDIVIDYIRYVEDEGAKAALLGPLGAAEAGAQADKEKADKERQEKAKPAADAVATPATTRVAKRKRESVAGEAEPVSDKRRRSSRYESTPTTTARTPATKPSATKRRHSELPDAPAPQATPRSTRRQSRIPPPAEDDVADASTATSTTVVASPVRQTRRKSSRASSPAPSATASTVAEATTTRRLSPAEVPRTMLWFMDDFTVGDMQKVCRFIDEHCSGKLRLPLYSGGNWDGKAASGRWEDVFMVSPLGRLGRYDDDDDEEREEEEEE